MQDKWDGMSYNKFPSFQTSFERSAYEQWDDHVDDIDDIILEYEEREDSAWVRKTNTCIFFGYGLFL